MLNSSGDWITIEHWTITEAPNSKSQRGWGGGLPYETDRDAYWNIKIKPLMETNLGVAQALIDP